jgi:FkbM family methyltransferase
MKQFLRRQAQALGLYEDIGIGVARFMGWREGIRINRLADSNFCLSNRQGRKMFIHRKHAIYLIDFVKYFDFYFDGVIPDANNEVHYENPGWHTPRHWGRPLFFTSFAESEEVMSLYLEHGELQAGHVVFDLGAYCGLTALAFAEKVGEHGHVYTFEPDPDNFSALQKNLEKYAPGNITAENAAIWKESGLIRFQAEGTVSSTIESLSPRTNATTSVKAIRLVEYLSSKNIHRLDLIKMDVEGAETDILDSSREVLQKYKPIVIVEGHRVREVMTTGACQAILHEEGYRTYEVAQPGTKSSLIVGKPAR